MKIVLLLCLFSVALGSLLPSGPGEHHDEHHDHHHDHHDHHHDHGHHVAILRDERVDNGDGNFNYAFQADNGINTQVSGTPGSEGQSNIEGVYVLPLADGSFAEVRFTADENGFQPQSDLLPTPHPIPAHVFELLRIAEEQRAAGITFD